MELKHCPFCGGAVKIDRRYRSLTSGVTFSFQWLVIKHIEKDADCRAYIEGDFFSEPISKEALKYEERKLMNEWNRGADNV